MILLLILAINIELLKIDENLNKEIIKISNIEDLNVPL